MLRVRKKNREQLPVMLDFSEQIERELESSAFDKPELWPAIYEARQHSAKLKAWLSELNYLVFEEEGTVGNS